MRLTMVVLFVLMFLLNMWSNVMTMLCWWMFCVIYYVCV